MNLIDKLKESIKGFDIESVEEENREWVRRMKDSYAKEMNRIIDDIEKGTDIETVMNNVETESLDNLDEINYMRRKSPGFFDELLPAQVQGLYRAQTNALVIAFIHKMDHKIDDQ